MPTKEEKLLKKWGTLDISRAFDAEEYGVNVRDHHGMITIVDFSTPRDYWCVVYDHDLTRDENIRRMFEELKQDFWRRILKIEDQNIRG